jgi:hypothetical protein
VKFPVHDEWPCCFWVWDEAAHHTRNAQWDKTTHLIMSQGEKERRPGSWNCFKGIDPITWRLPIRPYLLKLPQPLNNSPLGNKPLLYEHLWNIQDPNYNNLQSFTHLAILNERQLCTMFCAKNYWGLNRQAERDPARKGLQLIERRNVHE